MSDYIEYHTIDKSSWLDGPWKDEPDKIQFIDEETGLPCLIKRVDHSGHLCGYVGVEPTHPLHGKGYSDSETESLNAHGGITFASGCQDMSEKAWKKTMSQLLYCREEAKKFPIGEAAQFIQKWEKFENDYEGWKKEAEASFICHVPSIGQTDNIWWFGFDCAHADDRQPALESFFKSLHRDSNIYRDLDYVRAEIRDLAKQLKNLS